MFSIKKIWVCFSYGGGGVFFWGTVLGGLVWLEAVLWDCRGVGLVRWRVFLWWFYWFFRDFFKRRFSAVCCCQGFSVRSDHILFGRTNQIWRAVWLAYVKKKQKKPPTIRFMVLWRTQPTLATLGA